jgi:hypothetical protein
MVHKIESMEWERLDNDELGDGIIRIKLRDIFKPYLLEISYCDSIVVWWTTSADEHRPSVRVYAVQSMESIDESRPALNKVESWYDCDIIEALKWVQQNLT